MTDTRRVVRRSILTPLFSLLFLTLLLAACRPVDPSLELDKDAPEANSVAEALSTAAQTARKSRLVILHTNDTWGYYDPCG